MYLCMLAHKYLHIYKYIFVTYIKFYFIFVIQKKKYNNKNNDSKKNHQFNIF